MFGKYELLERLGKGGMAEVYLARVAGPLGISRFVALKRMLSDLPSDRGNSMFVDEMRLAVRLSHPNIVSVHDFGIEGENLYLAMEFVEGRDVHQILKYASRKQPPHVDIEAALYIIAQVARGLDFAHRLTGPDGRAAQIVHRDVSPANIMVTYSGDVKLADFGIARAAQHLRMTNTEAGEIKGKIRYMSPEQARGESVDYRTDLFALGIVLLELVTLAPAFAAESDIASLLRVQEGVPKDWEFKRKGMPADVLAVIEQAMAVDKDKRFGSGELMASGCELALRKRNPGYGPAQLAAYMHSMFAREHADWRSRLAGYEQQPAGSVDLEGGVTITDAPKTPSKPGGASAIPRDRTAPVLEMGPATGTGHEHIVRTPSGNQQILSLPSGGTPISNNTPVSMTPVVTGQLGQATMMTTAPRSKAMYAWVAVFGAAAVVGGFVIFKQLPHDTPAVVQTAAPAAEPPRLVEPPPKPTATAKPGRLVLTTNAMATRVFLDKNALEKSSAPVAAGGMSFKVDVPSGIVWTLRVEADGYKTVTLPLIVGAGEETTMPVVLPPEAAAPAAPIAAPVAPPPRRVSSGGRATAKKDTPPKPAEEKAAQTPAAARPTNPSLVDPF
jgi:serine/threonine protein kinase